MPTEAIEREKASPERRAKNRTKPSDCAPTKPKKLVPEPINPDLPKGIIINNVVDCNGRQTGNLLVRAESRFEGTVDALLPIKDLALGRCDDLAQFAVKVGLNGYLSPKGLRTLAASVVDHHGTNVFVVQREGFHRLTLAGHRYGFIVSSQAAYYLGQKPPLEIVIPVESGVKEHVAGDLDSWHDAIGVHLAGNPYMLVSVLAAMAPALARAFGLTIPILAIVAPSSQGKTTNQQVGLSVIRRADKIADASGTSKGLRVLLEHHPDQPVFLQDVHKAEDLSGLMDLLFLVANGGQRLTSTSDQKLQSGSELSCGLILSMEMQFMELVGNSKIGLPEGFSARCFEMVLEG